MTRRVSNGQWHIVPLKKTAGEPWMQKTIELYPVLSILQVREYNIRNFQCLHLITTPS